MGGIAPGMGGGGMPGIGPPGGGGGICMAPGIPIPMGFPDIPGGGGGGGWPPYIGCGGKPPGGLKSPGGWGCPGC